ncbi:MAG: hypothetical protein ACRC33_27020 [Gemmataceae bacterium]
MVVNQPPWWQWALAVLTCSWPFLILTAVRDSQATTSEFGKDRVYDLPLRLCPGCRTHVTSPAEATAALRRVALYSDLLDLYPRAAVFPPAP